jgi:Fe-S cluster assembly protein SufD
MSAPSTAVAHYREAFERLRPTLRGSPARRAAAFARFSELGFPGPREEAWKYTSLRRLEARRFAPAPVDPDVASVPRALLDQRIVIANGRLEPGGAATGTAGFTQRALGVAATEIGDEPLPRDVAGLGTERFAALNAAFAADPLLLEMPTGVASDEVLQLTLHTTGAGPVLASPRIVVRMGAGSRGRLMVEHSDDGAAEHFTNVVLDVELAAGAELTVYRLHRPGDRAFHIERVEARVAEGARFVMRDSQLGGSLSRLDLHVSLDGRGASTEVTGVFLADASRHLDTHVLIEHRAVETTSLQDYRGVAANKGRGVFNGKSIVHAGAQKSNARQVNRNLLLTPGVEIYADDVQCSHGTTTGQLDPNALFYLRSRGLDEAEARSALTRAFAGAVLVKVDEPALCNLVQEVLDRRLTRLLEEAA